MIWLAVRPTLIAINLVVGGWLTTLSPVPRTFVLTVAVPIVIHYLMPELHRLRAVLIARAARRE